jgi:hypothetical protein
MDGLLKQGSRKKQTNTQSITIHHNPTNKDTSRMSNRNMTSIAVLHRDDDDDDGGGDDGSDGKDHAVVGDHGDCGDDRDGGDEVAKKLLGLFMQNVHLAMSCCQVNSI